ncbi:MAG: hypothetical protein PWP49_1814 [Thermococcaceae archaeon]|uniref:PH1570 family protein n=1 Tax=Thermococcus sp. 101 C5 TaxID=2654197 RepID=UPI00128B6DD8|nr:PH1570 family protein [Thermococcus sp. 101 C5]MDN5321394.1 hypothetical protein [Thermococcaceae archaeon]MPW39322.1 hypothetical protein [Thermococcus sp. 101 C5]
MQCEEHLEVFENGFEDGKFNLRIEYYGGDARKVLLSIIYELYQPIYGSEYVYPFECAKEFWGIFMDPSEVVPEELQLSRPKFINQSLIDKAENLLEEIDAPEDVKDLIDVKSAEIYKLKDGLLVIGKNFLLDGARKTLFVFNKPQARELILKYLRR